MSKMLCDRRTNKRAARESDFSCSTKQPMRAKQLATLTLIYSRSTKSNEDSNIHCTRTVRSCHLVVILSSSDLKVAISWRFR